MFRTLMISAALLGISSPSWAHPEPQEPAKSITAKPQLPSQTEIQDALKQMPDMNAIMGEMMGLMKDEKFRANMERSADSFAKRFEAEDVFKTDADGMPDFNKAFAVMLGAFSDEEAMGGMMDTMMGLAETMEKHVPETAKVPDKEKAPE